MDLAGAVDYDELPEPKTAGRLPPEAAGLYRDLLADAEDASDAANGAQRRFLDARQDVQRLRMQLQDQEERHPRAAKSDRLLKGVRTEIEAGTAQVQELAARQAELAARAGTLVALANRLRIFLSDSAHAIITPYTSPLPKLGKAESPAVAVDRCRTRVTELRREAQTVANAPATSGEAKAAAREFVAAAAHRARPDVSPLLAGHATPHFPDMPEVYVQPVGYEGRGAVFPGGVVRDGFSLACWLRPDEVIAALDREIDAGARDDRALTAEAKAERLAALADELLAVERDEEAFLRMALAQGVAIDRRGDADPRAVLGVAIESERVQ